MNYYYLATNPINRAKKTTTGVLAKSSNDPVKSKILTLPEKMAACWLAAMLFADGITTR
jgi:hypothetical protein